MKKEEFIKLGLTEDLAKECEKASQEELKGFIPKARFDEVNNDKKHLDTLLEERNNQLEDLKKSTGDVEAMKKQIETLQNENKAKDDAHAAELKKIKVDTAVNTALGGAGAINTKAVIPFLKDMEKAEFDEDGTIKGLADQIKALQKDDSTKFLFNATRIVKGANPGASGNDPGEHRVDTSKLTYSEMVAYMAEHPDAKI